MIELLEYNLCCWKIRIQIFVHGRPHNTPRGEYFKNIWLWTMWIARLFCIQIRVFCSRVCSHSQEMTVGKMVSIALDRRLPSRLSDFFFNFFYKNVFYCLCRNILRVCVKIFIFSCPEQLKCQGLTNSLRTYIQKKQFFLLLTFQASVQSDEETCSDLQKDKDT